MFRSILAVLSCALALAHGPVHAQVTGDPVRIEGGLISGAWQSNASVRAYRGIPYAAPPVDELRWNDPQPVAPWQGVRAARTLGKQCIQPARLPDALSTETAGPQSMSEDCLYLNFWTPAASADSKLPVH